MHILPGFVAVPKLSLCSPLESVCAKCLSAVQHTETAAQNNGRGYPTLQCDGSFNGFLFNVG